MILSLIFFSLLSDAIRILHILPCTHISPKMFQMSNEVVHDLNNLQLGFEIRYSRTSVKNGYILCGVDRNSGYIGYFNGEGVYVDSTLPSNTLYNVLLHEILHLLGLDDDQFGIGMTSYRAGRGVEGYILDDPRRLWISPDEVRALLQLYF